MTLAIHQQIHGYKSGHQLLDTSIRLERGDQELVDRLSDMAGPLRPGERFSPYLTAYPLPSAQFYVFARTVQDLEAPRAGCVLSRSLIVPFVYWSSHASPSRLWSRLELLDGPAEPVVLHGTEPSPRLSRTTSPALTELVEALFLENRAPIVVFGTDDTEAIAVRLLSALWSGLRGRFSVCTLALSPRFVSERPFDLLFAPRTARSRFVHWPGRRIEAGNNPPSGRHRWSDLIRYRIFESAEPKLLEGQSIEGLGDTDDADETVLRLALLWDELRQKASSSPTAVLGLLDIANARSATTQNWATLRPAIGAALTYAVQSWTPQEAWTFIVALLGKLHDHQARSFVWREVRSVAAALALRDIPLALSTIAAHEVFAEEAQILESIAPALAGATNADIRGGLAEVAPDQLLRLCIASVACCRVTMGDELLCDTLASAINATPSISAISEATLPFISRPNHASIFRAVLLRASPASRPSVVRRVWASESARHRSLAEALVNAVGDTERLLIAEVLASTSSDPITNYAIERLLRPTAEDLAWLTDSPTLFGRRSALIAQLLGGEGSQIAAWTSLRADQITHALDALDITAAHYGEAAAFLLSLPEADATDVIASGARLRPLLSEASWKKFTQVLVRRAINDDVEQGSDALRDILTLVGVQLDVVSLIRDGIAMASDAARASNVMVALRKSEGVVRERILASIEALAHAVLDGPKANLSSDALRALADLLDCSEDSRSAHLRACTALLPLAMSANDRDTSPVILSTFPAVYRELRRTSSTLELFRIFSFVDWDRCKVARKDLVRAYLRSQWPPVDLVRVADACDDLDRILRRLLKEPGGAAYFRLILAGARRLRAPLKSAVQRIGRETHGSGSAIHEWDT